SPVLLPAGVSIRTFLVRNAASKLGGLRRSGWRGRRLSSQRLQGGQRFLPILVLPLGGERGFQILEIREHVVTELWIHRAGILGSQSDGQLRVSFIRQLV